MPQTVLPLLLFVGAPCAQDLRSRSDKSRFYFDLTFKNRGTTIIHLINVGIRSELSLGSFDCLGGSSALVPLADYPIRFHVRDKETVIKADPSLEIGPGQAARFTVSYVPNSIGECGGPWATDVSAILIFDDGKKYFSEAQRITGDEVREYNNIKPDDEQLLKALRHRAPDIRKQAVSQLADSGIDRDSLRLILESKLKDQDRDVRIEAAKVAATMHLKVLTPVIAVLLRQSKNDAEIIGYCEALGRLKDVRGVDALIDVLTDLSFDNPVKPAQALVTLGQPEVPIRVRPLLAKYISWAKSGASERQIDHYFEICKVLIKYRDVESVPALSALLSKPEFQPISARLASEVRSNIDENLVLQDPFFIPLKHVLDGSAHH
jgi:hypothetical protein